MFFDRFFLKVALTLFCSMFCASEMLAVPPGQDLPTPNTSTKRKVSESRGLPEDYLGNSSAILSTPGIFSSQTLALGTTPAKEKYESENKRPKTVEDASEEDAEFWATTIVAADAAEEEHRRAHSRQASLTPVTNPIDDAAFWAAAIVAADAAEEEYHRAHSQESPAISLGSEQPVQQLLSSPSARAPSLPEPEGHSPLAQRALSGTTEDELIHLLDEVDGGLRQVSSYSSAETQKNKVGKEQGLSSTAVSSAHSAAPARKQEDRVVKRKAERNLCRLKPIRGREHFHLLKNLIRSARDEILITTESIGFIPAAIIDSLRDAGNRRVKISVYSNKEPSDWAYDFFEEEGIRFEQLNIHGKHLIIDRSCAVIGSCNWLGFSDEEIGPGERSIEISGNPGYIHTLRGRTYSTIIKYREIFWSKMNNEPAPHTEFDQVPLNLSLNTSSQILLLTTLQHHEDYLKFICRDAKKYITIYSPFIIFPNAVRRLNMIAEEIKGGVELRIFLNEYDLLEGTREGYDLISDFIKGHPKLKGKTKLEPLQSSHRKTLIVDNETRSEGSFNWLSSAPSIESDFHNQDTSLVIQGPIVRDLFKRKRRHTLRN